MSPKVDPRAKLRFLGKKLTISLRTVIKWLFNSGITKSVTKNFPVCLDSKENSLLIFFSDKNETDLKQYNLQTYVVTSGGISILSML